MKKILTGIVLCICVVTLTGCGMAQRGAISWAYSDIEKGKYQSALQNLSDAQAYKEPTPELNAEILHLRAICYIGLGRCDEAVATLQYIIDKFPESSYAYQAKATLLRLEMLLKETAPANRHNKI